MRPSVGLALSCSVAVLTTSLALSQSLSKHPRQQTTTVGAHSIYGTPPAEQDMMPMPLVAPVFLQTDQIDSSITVVNSIIWSVQGTVTLRDQGGNIIGKATPTFAAHSSTVVSLKKLLADAGSLAHSGSVILEQDPQVKGPALLAQLSMTMHVGSQATYLEEEFGMPTMHGSAELRGVASETKNLPLIAITSVSEASQTIHAACIGESPADPGIAIELPAFGTAVVHACAWDTLKDDSLGLSSALQHAPGQPSQNHAVSLKTDSVPGAFYAFGFALNGSIAQAQLQPLDFYDPGLLPSTKTVYVGVPFGPESRVLKQSFSPTLTLANFSTQPRSTTVTVADSSSGTPKTHQLAQVSLPALSTRTVPIPAQSGSGLLNTFTIASDGQPGDVQAHLFSNRDSAEDRLELLSKDASDAHNGGDHPWSTENGNTSTLLLYNPTPTSQEFQVTISGNNASWVELYTLKPSETKDVSINDIISQQLLDLKQNKLPKDLLNGEVQWSTQFGSSGLGRLLVANQQASLKRSFSCPTYSNMCGASLGPTSYVDFPDDGFGTISAIQVVQCTEYGPNQCGQTSPIGAGYSFSTVWQNANNNSTSMSSSTNSSLTLKGIRLGSFSISAYAVEGSCQSPPFGGGGAVVPNITFTGHTTPLNGTTQSAVIGQQIQLTASYNAPLGANVVSQSWSVPGTTVGNYAASTSSGQTTAADFSNTSTTFYWVDIGSARTVQYTVNLSDGETLSAQVTFNVNGPTSPSVSTSEFQPAIYGSDPGRQMGIGNGTTVAGITFNANANMNGASGSFKFVQLIQNYTGSHKDPQGTCPINLGSGLDNEVPYTSASATSANDSPAVPLYVTDTEVSVNFSATMYLMWQPAAPSIMVPLGSVAWSWSADAVQSNNVWSFSSRSSAGSPAFVASNTFPQWTTLVTNSADPCATGGYK